MESIRYRYVTGFTKLSLWYVWRVVRTEAEPFADVVNKRVNIYRNTPFFDGKRHPSRDDVGPDWAAVVSRLAALYGMHEEYPATTGFEEAGLKLLWPYLEARLKTGGGGPAGERFRTTGTLPYAASACECEISESLDHLASRFPHAVEYNRRMSKTLKQSGRSE